MSRLRFRSAPMRPRLAPARGGLSRIPGSAFTPGGAILGPLLAFPFAQGYKVNSTLTGGRSLGAGEVRKVTNLNNSGAGSYRTAVATDGPADIVFEVGGRIQLVTGVPHGSDLTTWGETAPSPGITFIPATGDDMGGDRVMLYLDTGCSNVVMRHVRFRQRHDHASLDCSNFGIGNGVGLVMLANCSTAYNSDEGWMVEVDGNDITMYRNIMGPSAYPACKNLLIGGANPSDVNRIALIQNAHILSKDRNPEMKTGTKIVLYNQYIYGCGNGGDNGNCGNAFHAFVNTDTVRAATYMSVRGCQYEGGAVNRPQVEFNNLIGDSTPNHEVYWNDNPSLVLCIEDPAVVDEVANETDLNMTLPEVATVLSSSGIKAYVLARAGARPLDRDQVDTDAVADANAGTGTQNQGAPPTYSLGTGSATFNTPANPFDQASGEATGWRNLDKYIYENYTLAVEP